MGQAADEIRGYTGPDDYEAEDGATSENMLASDAADAVDTADSVDTLDASAGDSAEEPEQIRAQIEETRAEMSTTIDAIQEKLNPDNIKEQAKEAVREATVGRAEEFVNNAGQTAKGFGADMLETIRENPLPSALAAIGLGWLFMKRNENSNTLRIDSRGYGQYGGYSNDYNYNRASSLGYQPYGQQQYGQQQYYGRTSGGGGVGDKVGDAAQQAREKVGDVAGQAGDKVGQIGEKVGEMGSQVGDRVGDIGDQAQYRAEMAGDWFQRSLRENSLAVGAVAAALGAAVGLVLPETRQEHQMMGQARDNLLDKAQEAVQGTVQKVQRVADEAQNTVQREAQTQGLTGDGAQQQGTQDQPSYQQA